MAIYNRNSFHKHTYCVFTEVAIESIVTTANYKSKSGSVYHFTDDGVFRVSNHWGRAAKCKWRLLPLSESTGRLKAGFAKWSAFHTDNETEKLYYITIADDFSLNYFHRDSEEIEAITLLRTASETTKRIREIRQLLKNPQWLQHFDDEIQTKIRLEVITRLIHTNDSLLSIRIKLLAENQD